MRCGLCRRGAVVLPDAVRTIDTSQYFWISLKGTHLFITQSELGSCKDDCDGVVALNFPGDLPCEVGRKFAGRQSCFLFRLHSTFARFASRRRMYRNTGVISRVSKLVLSC